MEYLVAAGVLLYSWTLFYTFGWSESLYWHYFVRARKFSKNRPVKYEHELWTGMRVLFHLPVGIFLMQSFGWFSLLGTAGLIFMSFFVHDGSYYSWRNNWDSNIYKERWWAYSTTSTAKMTLKVSSRKYFFFFGLVLYLMMTFSNI